MMSTETVGQTARKYVIEGKIKGLIDKSGLFLIKNKDGGGSDTMLATKSKGEKFSFSGMAPFEGEPYFIKIDTSHKKYGKLVITPILVLIDGKRIGVTGSISNLSKESIEVRGSTTHDQFMEYSRNSKKIIKSFNEFGAKFDSFRRDPSNGIDAIREFQKGIDSAKEVFHNYRLDWILNNPGSKLSPWLISQAFQTNKDTQWLFVAYQNLKVDARESKYGETLRQTIEALKNTGVGSVAPDLKLPTYEGTMVSVHQVAQNSKLTLIDFWASWCGPCRSTFPQLKALYEKYKDQGFSVVGISTDQDIKAWKSVIEQDDLLWNNLICQDDELLRITYGIKLLPTCFLVDKTGRIVLKWVGDNKNLENEIRTRLSVLTAAKQ